MIFRRGKLSSPVFVVVMRVLLLLGALALAVAGFVLARRDSATASAAAEQYACPMHPEVTANAPAQCPICKMALERAEPAAAPRPESQTPKNGVRPSASARFAPGVTWLPETFPPAEQSRPGD